MIDYKICTPEFELMVHLWHVCWVLTINLINIFNGHGIWNSLHHSQAMHPTENFTSLILFKIPVIVTWTSLFFISEVRGSNQIWPMTSDEQDMRLGISAYMAAAAGNTSRILDTRPKVLISSTKWSWLSLPDLCSTSQSHGTYCSNPWSEFLITTKTLDQRWFSIIQAQAATNKLCIAKATMGSKWFYKAIFFLERNLKNVVFRQKISCSPYIFYISIDSLFNMMSPIEVAYQFKQKISSLLVTTSVHNKQNNCLWDLNNFTADYKIRWVGRSEKYRIFQICLL